MVLNDPVKLTWPLPNLCPSSECMQWSCQVTWPFFNSCPLSGSMWWVSMILSSWPDHFPISGHPQRVCDCSWWSCQVGLTISESLSILRMYMMFFNNPFKLTWQFPNLCLSSGCMSWCSMILSSSPDQFPIIVHPQNVSDASQLWSCQVDLCISQSLFTLRKYIMFPNDCIKLTWPFPNQDVCDSSQWSGQVNLTISNLCPSSACVWWFLMILSCWPNLTISQSLSITSEYFMFLNDSVKLTWQFSKHCPSSASMQWFSKILSSWLDHFPITLYPQQVCDGSQWSCQVDQTISQSLSILRMYAMILSSWSDHWPVSVHAQFVCDGSQWSFQVVLTISQCLSIHRMYVIVLNDLVKLTWPFPHHCPSSACMWWLSMILSSWPDHFPISVHPQLVCDGSQWSCQVDLTISQFPSILSKYVMAPNDPFKLTWPFPNIHPFSESMW